MPTEVDQARPDLAASHTATARDPSDVTRMLGFLGTVVVGIFAARGAPQTTAGFEADLVGAVARLPLPVVAFVLVGVQTLHLLLVLGIPLYMLVRRRWRRWALFTAGWVATVVLTAGAENLLGIAEGPSLAGDPQLQQLSAGLSSQGVATAVFAVVLLSESLSRPWRRFGWTFVAVLAVLVVATAQTVVLDLVLAVGIGGAVATAILLAFGRRIEMPTPTAVLAGLDRVALHASTVEPLTAATSAYRATLPDGRLLHCKVVSSSQHEIDGLLRRYRRIRLRELGEEVAYSTVRRAAAVEAMLAMTARQAGARTPAVAGLAPLPVEDAMVIAFEHVSGERLSAVAAERLTDAVLDQAWASVVALRLAGVAHRDLQLSSWILEPDDTLWLIDFSFGEPAATDGALRADIAELLAATYAVVGADRAVASALRALGPSALGSGLSHLVPMALTRTTRSAVKAVPSGLTPLVGATSGACAVAEPEFAPIERVKPRTLLMAGLLALAVYVLLPQLADLPRMLQAIREADPTFAAAAAAASVVTYLGAGMAIVGSSIPRIRLPHASLASVSATFVGAFAPPGVAHVGLSARFFAKQGMPPPVAISATAAKEVAVGTVHVVLLIVLAILAGSSGALREELDKLPSARTLGIAVAIVLALVLALAAVPKVRTVVRDTVVPAVRDSLGSLRELAASPTRMLVLFLGGLTLQLGYVAALYFSTRALGGDVGFTTIGLIYLTVGSVATVAPTPGGLGAVEAVLLAALTGVGMTAATALAAVFLYRLMTFWLPIPAGGMSFRYLVSRDLL
jgi:glycosyltransferase 2 family protein